MTAPKPKSVNGLLTIWGVAVLSALATGAIATCLITIAIWPGEMKLTKPLFCDTGTQARVVADTWSDSEGTSTNYTLYCLGPRGETKDAGAGYPFGVLVIAHTLIIAAIGVAIRAWAKAKLLARRRTSAADPPPAAKRSFTFDSTKGDDNGPSANY